MSKPQELQSRIRAVAQTEKAITALYRLSAVRVRRARAALEEALPYVAALTGALRTLAAACDGERYCRPEGLAEARRCILVLGPERGTSGPLCATLRRAVQALPEKETVLYVHGQACREALTGVGLPCHSAPLPDGEVTLSLCRRAAETLLRQTYGVPAPALYLLYITSAPGRDGAVRLERLLPLHPEKTEAALLIEPSPPEAWELLLPEYLAGCLYCAALQTCHAEQAARMRTRKAAKDNAHALLEELTRLYQTQRQEAITQALAEIAAGKSHREETE